MEAADSIGSVDSRTIAALKAPAAMKAVLFVCQNIRIGGLRFVLPDGRTLSFGEEQPARIATIVVRDYAFAKRVLAAGDIGFAEGYMAGEWDTPDLTAVLEVVSANIERMRRLLRGARVAQLLNGALHRLRDNTRAGARRNIHAHYDLGERFYSAWLDPSMTYSSAKFTSEREDLETAQLNKYRAIAQELAIAPGDRVLEIGCGWGGFAEIAAKEYGAAVTGLTISERQHAFARERMRQAGLAERVDIRLQDYRDVGERFDKVVSIEMFEAVGERHWGEYFGKIREVLRPGGRAVLQVITIADAEFERYRRRVDFIQRYIFPGGMLPSLARLQEEIRRAELAVERVTAFGQSYARTLAEWGERFTAAWEDIKGEGFDERFRRLWRFYLSYCEAGFRTARTDVVQVALARA